MRPQHLLLVTHDFMDWLYTFGFSTYLNDAYMQKEEISCQTSQSQRWRRPRQSFQERWQEGEPKFWPSAQRACAEFYCVVHEEREEFLHAFCPTVTPPETNLTFMIPSQATDGSWSSKLEEEEEALSSLTGLLSVAFWVATGMFIIGILSPQNLGLKLMSEPKQAFLCSNLL